MPHWPRDDRIDRVALCELFGVLGCNASARCGGAFMFQSLRGVTRITAATGITFVLGSCASSGIQGFQTYRSAFESTYATSTSILDQLAIQERAIGRRQYKILPGSSKFDPDLATYYSDTADPPGTAAFRRALTTVKAYNDLLYALASGQSAEAMVARIATLNASVGTSLEAANSLLPVGGTTQLAIFKTGFDAFFSKLQPLLAEALKFRSQAEFRRFLVKHYPLLREMLLALRSGTRVIFPMLTDELRREAGGNDAKIADYRKLLGDWVILIDGTIRALDQAVAAIEAPPTLDASITALNVVASDLQSTADAARKDLARLSTH